MTSSDKDLLSDPAFKSVVVPGSSATAMGSANCDKFAPELTHCFTRVTGASEFCEGNGGEFLSGTCERAGVDGWTSLAPSLESYMLQCPAATTHSTLLNLNGPVILSQCHEFSYCRHSYQNTGWPVKTFAIQRLSDQIWTYKIATCLADLSRTPKYFT